MRPSIFSVGVDLGGTWIRLEAVNAQGKRVRSLKAPAPSLNQLPAFLAKRLRVWKARPPHLIVASRGIWTRPERAQLKRSLRSLAPDIRVMSDVEAAWYAAFGSRGTGVVVISGTGSIAYGRDADGCSQRAGGWGPLLGDEGSAFWMGKTWLKRIQPQTASHDMLKWVRYPHRAVRRVAAQAPRILHQAQKGNRIAQAILSEAQQHLAELVLQTARGLHFKRIVPLSWGGSLLNNSKFRNVFLKFLQRAGRRAGRQFQVTPPGQAPALTMARLRN